MANTGDDDSDERDSEHPESSDEIDGTGWSRDDDEAAQRKRNKRKRITLDVFAGPPLELPRTSRHDAIPPGAEDRLAPKSE